MAWFEHGTSRIYYETHGSGDPLLLMPGWSQSGDDLAGLREALVGAGYRVIAVDLPGSGRSLPQPRHYTADYYDVDAAALGALLRQLGAGPAHLVGFSDGGEEALIMAEQFPELARTIVTWGAGGFFSDPSGQLRGVMANLVDHPIPPMQGYRDFLVDRYGEANARLMTQSLVVAIGEIIEQRGGDLSRERAGEIKCPALLIAGEHDLFVPPDLLSALAERVPHADVWPVAGAGHDVHNVNPPQFAERIINWLKQHEAVLS